MTVGSQVSMRCRYFTRQGMVLSAIIFMYFNTLYSISAQEIERPEIRRGDTVFMYDEPEHYQEYQITALGWAGSPANVERAHQSGVRMFSSSVGFRTEAAGMIDYCESKYGAGTKKFTEAQCRDLDGNPFIVPWLWDHQYKGEPAWHFCSNSPLFREFLIHRAVETAKAGVDGLHIDDYTGTAGPAQWGDGCFCEHCMKLYREDLTRRQTEMAQSLTEDGISLDALSTFDYGEFLRKRGVDAKKYKTSWREQPLGLDFVDFQYRRATAFIGEYHHMAEEAAEHKLALAVNSGMWSPLDLVIAPHLTYFCGEVSQNASDQKVPTHPIAVYKLADALSRPMTSTASGQDWAFINENHGESLVRSWTVLSYVFGHNFMAPEYQWCYTEEKGTHWYRAPKGAYADLYRFVHEHRELFDGYEAVAPMAILFDMAARLQWKADIEPAVTQLALRNIPFEVVVAGNEWLPQRLTEKTLTKYQTVFVDPDWQHSPLDAAQKSVLEAVQTAAVSKRPTSPSATQILPWTNEQIEKFATSESGQKWVLRTELADGTPVKTIGVVPRQYVGTSPETAEETNTTPVTESNVEKPAVIHLYNRDYDATAKDFVPCNGLTLRFSDAIFPGKIWKNAKLVSPDAPEQTVAVDRDADGFRILIPSLKLWTIVVLTP